MATAPAPAGAGRLVGIAVGEQRRDAGHRQAALEEPAGLGERIERHRERAHLRQRAERIGVAVAEADLGRDRFSQAGPKRLRLLCPLAGDERDRAEVEQHAVQRLLHRVRRERQSPRCPARRCAAHDVAPPSRSLRIATLASCGSAAEWSWRISQLRPGRLAAACRRGSRRCALASGASARCV